LPATSSFGRPPRARATLPGRSETASHTEPNVFTTTWPCLRMRPFGQPRSLRRGMHLERASQPRQKDAATFARPIPDPRGLARVIYPPSRKQDRTLSKSSVACKCTCNGNRKELGGGRLLLDDEVSRKSSKSGVSKTDGNQWLDRRPGVGKLLTEFS